MSLLSVNNLNVTFDTHEGSVHAVKNLSFSIKSGQTLGIVGESGSGKTQTAFAIMGLLAKNGIATGQVEFQDRQILNLPTHELNKIRGQDIAMIFQDPMTSLNSFMRIDDQLNEVLIKHQGMSTKDATATSVRMLDAVRIPDAKRRMSMFPHELSGGMRQRVMIAMALLCNPKLLIADEPTTALDVTVQAQILSLMKDIKKDFNTSMILITHDLGVVAGICDQVVVMYAGSIVEHAESDCIFHEPTHPYTQGLLRAIPRLDTETEKLLTIPGNPPNLLHLPKGCSFRERCSEAHDACKHQVPNLVEYQAGRKRACFWQAQEYSA